MRLQNRIEESEEHLRQYAAEEEILKAAGQGRWEWVFAASILALIPVVVLFLLFQRKMVVGGLTQGAVKG